MKTAPVVKRHWMMRVKSREALAKRYDRSVKTIGNWLVEGAPHRKGGYYNLKDWDAWVKKYKLSKEDESTLAQVILEIKREDLLEKRRLRQVFEQKMVDAETVRKDAFALAKQITSVLTRIPPQIGSILGVEAQRRAQVVVEEALNILKEDPLGEISP
jgi:phage terminase Nu1 subunit (DNA packaging protein)